MASGSISTKSPPPKSVAALTCSALRFVILPACNKNSENTVFCFAGIFKSFLNDSVNLSHTDFLPCFVYGIDSINS